MTNALKSMFLCSEGRGVCVSVGIELSGGVPPHDYPTGLGASSILQPPSRVQATTGQSGSLEEDAEA